MTPKTRQCLKDNCPEDDLNKNWELIGWIISSPRQRLVVLRAVDERKLYSEEIRAKATQFNCHLSRTSAKTILNSLVEKHLIDSETLERVRFYWINHHGLRIRQDINAIVPISPLFS